MCREFRWFLPFFTIIISFLLSFQACLAANDQCSLLLDDFSGSSGLSWTPNLGTWSVFSGKVEARVTDDVMSGYASNFIPSDFFVVDVDVEWVAGKHIDAAYGIFPYTSGLTLFQIDGRDVSGIGVIVYPNRDNVRLLAWDVPGQKWYQSEPLNLDGTVTSIGIAYQKDRVILRLNKKNTTLFYLGDFSYVPGIFDTLWLLAQFGGTQVRFDNVCASTESEEQTLSVTKSGTGSGSIISTPEGISCGTDCTEIYNGGTSVILSATPESGSTFSGWSGGGCSGTGNCAVTLNSDVSIVANFSLKTLSTNHALSVTKSGTGEGLVISFPPGINAGNDFTESYNVNTTVMLMAIPSPGSVFSGWSGSKCKDTGDCTVFMNGDMSVTAAFSQRLDPLTKLPLPSGQQNFAYGAITSPIMNADPSRAKPIGLGSVAEWGDMLDFKIALTTLSAPADIYIAIFCPSWDPPNLYLLRSDNSFVSYSSAGLVPWKQGVTREIAETLFEGIPVSVLPDGRYHFYVAVIPSSGNGEYYLWSTSYSSGRPNDDVFISISGLGGSTFVTSEENPEFSGIVYGDLGINRVEYLNETSGRSGVASGTKEWLTNIELLEGDNKITFFAIADDDSESKISTKVTYYPDQAFKTSFDISDDILYVNETKEILFSIGIDSDTVDAVKLLRTDKEGAIQSIEALLSDDGVVPDQPSDDGIYTVKKAINVSGKGLLCFKIGVSQAEGKNSYYSEKKCILVTEHYTNKDIQTAVNAADSAGKIYENALAEGKSLEEAVKVVEDRLRRLSGMGAVEVSPEGTLGWITDAGILGGLDPEGYDRKLLESGAGVTELAASYKTERRKSNDFLNENRSNVKSQGFPIGSRKAIIIQACKWNMERSNHHLTVWPIIKNNDTSSTSCKKLYAAKEVVGESVPLDAFKNLSDYGYIHIHTHGYKGYIPFFSWDFVHSEDDSFFRTHYPALDTCNYIDKKTDGTYDIIGYEDDLQAKRIAIYTASNGHSIVVMPSFIKRYVHLPRSIVHLSACFSMRNNLLADAFIKAGAAVVLGYKRAVRSAQETVPVAKVVLEELYKEKNMQEIFPIAKQVSKTSGSDLLRMSYAPLFEGKMKLQDCDFPRYYEGLGTHIAIDDRTKYKASREARGYEMPGDWYANCAQKSKYQAILLENGSMELKICDCLSAFVNPEDGSRHCYNWRNTEEEQCRITTRDGDYTLDGSFQLTNWTGDIKVSGTHNESILRGKGEVKSYFGGKEMVDVDFYDFFLPRVESLNSCIPSENSNATPWDQYPEIR